MPHTNAATPQLARVFQPHYLGRTALDVDLGSEVIDGGGLPPPYTPNRFRQPSAGPRERFRRNVFGRHSQAGCTTGPYPWAMRLHLIRSKMVGYPPAYLAGKRDSTLLVWLP